MEILELLGIILHHQRVLNPLHKTHSNQRLFASQLVLSYNCDTFI